VAKVFHLYKKYVKNSFAAFVYITVHQHTWGIADMAVGSCGTCNTSRCSRSGKEQTNVFI
jgi:hypothetical protein